MRYGVYVAHDALWRPRRYPDHLPVTLLSISGDLIMWKAFQSRIVSRKCQSCAVGVWSESPSAGLS